MANLLVRTVLAPLETVTVDTSGVSDIVINVTAGQVAVESIFDPGETDGYNFGLSKSVVVAVAADSMIFEGRGKDGGTVEVYSA